MAQKTDNKVTKRDFFFGVGRRKEATARVRLYSGDKEVTVNGKKVEKGQIFVNKLEIEKYFPGELAKAAYVEPFRTTNTLGRYKTTVLVSGSGKSGQIGAVVLGVARALSVADPEKFHPILSKKGLLRRDPRAKERKKPGLMGARKQKSSPKR